MAKTYQWDKYQHEANVKPFVIDGIPDWHPASDEAGGPGSITIPVPGSTAFFAAEVAQTAQESLRLLCGPQWDSVRMLITGQSDDPADDENPPGEEISMPAAVALVQDITRHFSLGEDKRPPVVGRR